MKYLAPFTNRTREVLFIILTILLLISIITVALVLRKSNLDDRSDASSTGTENYLYAYNFDSPEDFIKSSVDNSAVSDVLKESKFIVYNRPAVSVDTNNQFNCYEAPLAICGLGNLLIKTSKVNLTTKVEKNFPNLKNAVLSIKMYDDGSDKTEGVVAISDNSNSNRVWVGIRNSQSKTNYVYQIDDTYYDSGIKRSKGWKLIDFFVSGSGAYATINKQRINNSVSKLTTLSAMRMFSFPATALGDAELRFDNILAQINLRYTTASAASQSFPTIQTPSTSSAQKITLAQRTTNFVQADTSKYRLNINLTEGKVEIIDRLNNINIPAVNGASFYDDISQIRPLSLKSFSGNVVTLTGTLGSNKNYSIYIKVQDEGVLMNISSPTAFLPKIKMKSFDYMYGLGENVLGGNLFIDKGFSDKNFSTGTLSNGDPNSDIGRMRTPILMSPQARVGYALFDDKVKEIKYDQNEVLMGLSKEKATSFQKAFAVVTGKNAEDLYKNFHSLRKSLGYPVLTPKYDSFGVGYEIYGDYGCDADSTKVINRVNQLKQLGIKLNYVVLGSGYWTGQNFLGCPAADSYKKFEDTTTDSFQTNKQRYPDSFFSFMKNENIKIIIGMRTNLSVLKYDSGLATYQINPAVTEAMQRDFLIKNADGSIFHSIFYGQGTHLVYLDASKAEARLWFLNKVKQYGNIAGIKEDTMAAANQGYGQYLSEDKVYPMTEEFAKSGFIERCRNEFFSLSCDVQLTPGYHFTTPNNVYEYSIILDKVLQLSQQHAFSGYYNPGFEIGGSTGFTSGKAKNDDEEKMVLRAIQLSAFFPGLDLSKPLWETTNADYKSKFVYFSQLHQRLQNYLYDTSVEAYNTGVPLNYMPLVIAYPNDPMVYNSGRAYSNWPPLETNTNNSAEFMVGRSLLVAPVTSLGYTRSVYLPAGTWYDIFTGQKYQGNRTIQYTLNNTSIYPVFAKAGEPFTLKLTIDDKWENRVRIFPGDNVQTVYKHFDHTLNNTSVKTASSTVTVNIAGAWDTNWNINQIQVLEVGTNKKVQIEKGPKAELMFNMEEGKSYVVEKVNVLKS